MKKYIYLFFIVAFAGSLMSNRNGRAASTGLGSTGAPGDDATVCKSCHNGPIDVSLDIFVLDQNDTIKEYEPNKNYSIHVRVNHVGGNTPTAYGFQLTGLLAPINMDGANIKNIVAESNNVKTSTARNQRLYAEHRDRSLDNIFKISWTAPGTGSGPVSFYAAGNGVNSNNNSNGDGSNKRSIQLNEKTISAVADASKQNIKVYPNPFQNQVFVNSKIGLNGFIVRDLLGKQMLIRNANADVTSIDLSAFPDGIYFLECYDANKKLIKTSKLLKRDMRP